MHLAGKLRRAASAVSKDAQPLIRSGTASLLVCSFWPSSFSLRSSSGDHAWNSFCPLRSWPFCPGWKFSLSKRTRAVVAALFFLGIIELLLGWKRSVVMRFEILGPEYAQTARIAYLSGATP